ncbi:MAG: helix-turn-helix transcriptional regulator [Epulopiscium sp.]|nr:helix-turn-helix transcriptional regulator [Candidatus Epulonipiscium sp.]
MPFRKLDVKAEIQHRCDKDPEFKEAYDIIDKEYTLIEKAVLMRKEQGYTQKQIAQQAGLTQQVISRIERLDNTPTLRNFIKYLDAAGLELIIKKKDKESKEEKEKVLF